MMGDHDHAIRARVARCRQLPKTVKQQLTAQMALVGWTFPLKNIYTGTQVNVEQYTLVSPIGEGFRYFLDEIEDAGFYAFELWNDKSQAMWTGRKLEDFDAA